MFFLKTETAKQNKNFLSILCGSPPKPPPKKEGKENFWFCTRVKRASEVRHESHHARGAYEKVSNHHALRALRVNRFAIGNKFEQRL
jgi:hypothetical protein